ncbi:MAG: hypothetical protein A3J24_00310 [Deltaproteobacteria bacterium RIFCSPLOWO2_02_FULL_53_8]|nr:MAG: hypothetical protein A3J24_00310 [Deltaproteobacteria bacterium RIFCSPLOWO2_02_FULL_53_8]
MNRIKKTVIVSLLASFIFVSTVPAAFAADDALQKTVNDALYGGLLGALVGTAVTLLSKEPSDNLGNIPTGAALGVLFGAAYGLATSSGTVQSVGEIEGTKFTLQVPTVERVSVYDSRTAKTENIQHIGLIKYKF